MLLGNYALPRQPLFLRSHNIMDDDTYPARINLQHNI